LTGELNQIKTFNGVKETTDDFLAALDDLGSPKTFNHYHAAWAWAGDSPFQWTKQIASHFGGTRNGLVVAWGDRIKDKGGLRSQFHHVIDIAPTIIEAAGIETPEVVNGAKQQPIEGTSLVYSFDDPAVPSHHKTQYFEMLGNRAIYDNGWVAAARHGRLPWELISKTSFDEDKWELYNVANDFSESKDLAKENPAKLAELQSLFQKEAKKHKVFPLDDRLYQRFEVEHRPNINDGRDSFTYYTAVVGIPETSAPNIKNRSFSITADVDTAKAGAEGVLATQGGRFAGWSLFLKDNKPTFVYNYLNSDRTTIQSSQPIAIGKSKIRFDFTADGGAIGAGGTGKIFINDKQVAEGRIEKTVAARFGIDDTFDIGQDTGTPVVDSYQVPFKFTGNLEQLKVDLL
ncbi:MAG: sulfatase/phosphatase domain-containing protein, partial [Pseudanabaena sp.]